MIRAQTVAQILTGQADRQVSDEVVGGRDKNRTVPALRCGRHRLRLEYWVLYLYCTVTPGVDLNVALPLTILYIVVRYIKDPPLYARAKKTTNLHLLGVETTVSSTLLQLLGN